MNQPQTEMIATSFLLSHERSTLAAALLTFLVGFSAVLLLHPTVRGLETAAIGETAGLNFEMAVNLAWCGRYPYLTSMLPPNIAKINLLNLQVAKVGFRSVRSLIDDGVGSVTAYCRLEATAFSLHETSIIAVESLLLAVRRQITVAHLAYGIHCVALAGLLIFAFALLKIGWPVLFVGFATTAALYLTILLGGSALYTQYPLILPTTLAGIGIGALFLAYDVHTRAASFGAAAFVLGIWAGFLGNLRTSHYPTAVFVGGLFIAFGLADSRNRASRPRRRTFTMASAVTAALALGILTFDRVWIAPMRAVPNVMYYTYHVIAHPLVLGLATPPSALAKREHIEWDDRSGVRAAKTIDPTVAYLGPGYERALFLYYRGLWARYPSEMLDIYLTKLGVTRRHAEHFLSSAEGGNFWHVKDDRWLPLAAWPASKVASGIGVVGLFAAMLIVACYQPSFIGIGGARGFVLAAMAVAGTLGFVESAVVLSGVILWYSTTYLFALVFTGLVMYQSTLDVCWSVIRRLHP